MTAAMARYIGVKRIKQKRLPGRKRQKPGGRRPKRKGAKPIFGRA